MRNEESNAEAQAEVLDPFSKCPECGYRFSGACYVIAHEDSSEEVLCDCCIGPCLVGDGAIVEDASGRRARVRRVELDF